MRHMLMMLVLASPLPASAAVLDCAGSVAPELAYPDGGGTWRGKEITLCRDVAKALGEAMRFTPLWQDGLGQDGQLQDGDVPARADLLFAPAADIPPGFVVGPVIYDDAQMLMVPAGSPVRHAADLAGAEICVQPGTPEEFALRAYFTAHHIPLHEFAFQEPDEMHDAYVAGRCDAITARRSLLIGLRGNEMGARAADVILPDVLASHPVNVASRPALAGLVRKTLGDEP